MWVFHPELLVAGIAIQAKLAADFSQMWVEVLSPPERGLVVPYQPRVRVTHHHEKPAPVLQLADHR